MDEDTWRKARMCLTDYASLIQEFRSREYQEVDFTAAEPDRRHLVLRHDVDMCLDRAAAMATVEAELGVSASYFLLVDTEMYNVGSRHARNLVGEILRHGHKIGLHFDGSGVPEGDVDALHKEVRLECEILEQHIGYAVTVVTFHRPQQWLMGFRASSMTSGTAPTAGANFAFTTLLNIRLSWPDGPCSSSLIRSGGARPGTRIPCGNWSDSSTIGPGCWQWSLRRTANHIASPSACAL